MLIIIFYTIQYPGDDVVETRECNYVVGRFHYASGVDEKDDIQTIEH